MIVGGVGDSDGEGAGGRGFGCGSVRGAGVVVGWCWVAFGLDTVGNSAGLGAAVVCSGCGLRRAWSLGAAGPSPLLAEGWVGGTAGWSTRAA